MNGVEMIHVKTPEGGYPIFLEHDGLSHVGKYLQNAGFSGVCAVVTNTTVEKYYAEKTLQSLMNEHFQPVLCEIPDGEEFKTLETAASLYDQFIQGKLDRKSPVLALGGGVVGDIAGFAAASFLRGVPFVQIPTTLLSMVDSSVGGKTGVNLPQGKNLVGAFKHPEMVLIDLQVLTTLLPAEFRSGLGEVVKSSIIGAPELFTSLEKGNVHREWMIAEAIKVKVKIVQEDPFERGRRAVLNLGHTFAHAFEKLSDFKLRHGEAVAIGTVCAARLAVKLGYCSEHTLERIVNVLTRLELPTQPPDYDRGSIWQAMETDKKKESGKLRFILPRDIGDVDIFKDIPEMLVKEVLS